MSAGFRNPIMAALLIATVTACSTTPPTPASSMVGRQIAERRCAGCHAIELVGASLNPQAPPFRDLYKRYPVEGLRPAFTKGLKVAHPMPRFRLDQTEIDRLLAYLASLNPCARPSSDQAAMERCFAPL